MATTIRQAGAGDADAARACIDAAFEPYIVRIGKKPAPMLLDLPALVAEGKVWLAEKDGETAGALVQYTLDGGHYIDTVASAPEARGTGVGKALLVFAEQTALARGFDSVWLATNSKMVENQALYTKVGYVEFDRTAASGYDRILYRKRLR